MEQQERDAVDDLLRNSPLDSGGEVREQRGACGERQVGDSVTMIPLEQLAAASFVMRWHGL
ncbi:MAG TPA: hypothetical protein VF060_01785 [Trebonia sp.]